MSAETKWTPGPWIVEHGEHGGSWGGYWQISGEYDAIACNQSCYAGYGKPEVSTANANLLAAAPALYDALAHLVHWHDQLSASDIAKAEAALSLARGEG